LETVIGAGSTAEGFATGLFFREQTAESVKEAILEFDRVQDMFNPIEIRRHAARFDTQNFVSEIASIVEETMERSGSTNWATSGRLADGLPIKDSSDFSLASVQRQA
jgi:hypothetical protein